MSTIGLGGGVTRRGCFQEEMLFIIRPECLASLLFTPVMRDNEVDIDSYCFATPFYLYLILTDVFTTGSGHHWSRAVLKAFGIREELALYW